MNVKPGDIARVVAPYHPNGRGAIVVVNRAVDHTDITFLHTHGYSVIGDAWLCSGRVRNCDGVPRGPVIPIADAALRRIDPGEGEDEILRIAGKPQGVAA